MQKCPNACIKMAADHEGFLFPQIDYDLCVNCGACISCCPQSKPVALSAPQECYAASITDQDTLLDSSSGGMFSALAEEILSRNGVVFGCSFSREPETCLSAVHQSVESPSGLHEMRGSKYVQSDTGHTYQEVKKCLNGDRWVLYTGTPCEIAGLTSFLGKDYEKLITVDLICHGVPSPLLFKKYIEYCARKVDGKILTYKFRDKYKSGIYYYYYYYLENRTGQVKSRHGSRDRCGYLSAFSHGDTYREVCYKCRYAQNRRTGDLSIGDYFAIEFQHPEFNSRQGVSSVLVNTVKGKQLMSSVAGRLALLKVQFEEIAAYNLNLQRPTARTSARDNAYANISGEPETIFEAPPFKVSAKAKVIALLKEHLPNWVLRRIRKVVFQRAAKKAFAQ